jgi:hypothetical protein
MNAFYMTSHRLPPWPTDREEVLEWIKQGRNPFPDDLAFFEDPFFSETPFQQASKRRDLELLLHMVAEPGTAWTKRFLFCRNSEVAVPAKGRACISSLDLSRIDGGGGGRYYFGTEGNSMEGLEVLTMYGYKLSEGDIDNISFDEILMPDDDPTYLLKMVKFCLATTSSSLATGESSNEIGKNHLVDAIFESLAFEPPWNLWAEDRYYIVELARVLLKAGANPNPQGSCPALFGAIIYRFKEMAKLLIEYGADVSAVCPPGHGWLVDNGEGSFRHYPGEAVSVALAAERHGMLELGLDRPATPVVVNAREYIHQLRLEITMPLRIAISEILVVAFMRATGQTPPVGIISSSIFSFCNFMDYD